MLHKKGKDNVVINALSQEDKDVTTCVTTIVTFDWLNEIWIEYVKDLESYSIINNLDQNLKFKCSNEIICYKEKIYLTPSSKFKIKVLRESHSSLAVGHVGFFKTYYNAHKSFYWKGMNKDIWKYVVEYDICQTNKNENAMSPGLLHPLHIHNQKWKEISMDFIKGLPMLHGKDNFFVVVDRRTKHAHFMGLWKKDSTKQIAKVFCKNIYKLYVFSKVVVSNKDAKFKGNFWRYFCKQIGILLDMNSAYHPQMDGQIEIVNKCLESYLCGFVRNKQNKLS